MLVAVGCDTPSKRWLGPIPFPGTVSSSRSISNEPFESIPGTYEDKIDGVTFRLALTKNGIVETYLNSKKQEEEGNWRIVVGEIHIDRTGSTTVYKINPDGSITEIAMIDRDGKQEDIPKDKQLTLIKVK